MNRGELNVGKSVLGFVDDFRNEDTVKRMHTAVKLNELIVNRSHDAQLVIVNLPGPLKETKGECDDSNCKCTLYLYY